MASASWDGLSSEVLERRLGLPRVAVHASVPSTMDAAHALGAAGAPGGTLVLADEQTAGRGRGGRRWASEPGAGIWLTLLERPGDDAAIEPLSLRLGLRAAEVLDGFAGARVRVKWPNDLYVEERKLAGILVETRWREGRVDWVAIGFGLNVRPPAAEPAAAGLRPGARRTDVLAALVPALHAAVREGGPLSQAELDAFAARDLARGRRCVAPTAGTVLGIDARGELLVRTPVGDVSCRSGSLILEEGT